jgi:hypothetical protein
MENLPAPIESTHPIWEAIKEIQQARSDFQLENFVVNQHDTPEQQYRQTVLELQELIFAVKKVDLEIKKTTLEIEKLRGTNDAIEEIEAQMKEVDLERSNLARLGAIKEIQTLLKIWEGFDHKYTAEEIEEGQVVYWDARLTRQAHLEAIGSNGSVAWGSLDALRQIGKLKLTEDVDNVDDAVRELK